MSTDNICRSGGATGGACIQGTSAFILRDMSSEGANAFITRWAAGASERANSQPFLCELCSMLGQTRADAGNGLRVRIRRNGAPS
jgi:hypothetical protein